MLTLLEYVSNETCSSALAGTTVTGKRYKDLILLDFLLQRYNNNNNTTTNNTTNNNNNTTNNISYYLETSYNFLQRNSSHQI